MKDTVKCLLEMTLSPDVDFVTENTAALGMLDTITEAARSATAYIPQKVMVQKVPGEGYIIEFANNLERLMLDQDLGIVEAMNIVADVNEIPIDECSLVFDESCLDKINIGAVIKLDPEFDIVRK